MERIYVCRVIVGHIFVLQYFEWSVQQQNVFGGHESSDLFELRDLSKIIEIIQYG